MTGDQELALAGVVIGAVGAIAAGVGAIFAFRADRASRSAASDERRRWTRAIQPRPAVSIMGAPSNETVRLQVGNPGGAVTDGFVLVKSVGHYYGCRLSIAEHSVPLEWNAPMLGHAEDDDPAIVLLIARDVDSHWWDCLEQRALREPPPDIPGSEGFTAWVNARLAQRQL